MLRDVVGNRSTKVKNTIEKGAVKKFAEAIGDAAPIYVDEEVGQKSRYGGNIAPPTFAITLDFGQIPDLKLPAKGLIHGEQTYHYTRPLFVGEDVYCFAEIEDYYEKTGNHGEMGFLVTARYGEDEDGNLLFKEKRIIILNEAVRKGMLV